MMTWLYVGLSYIVVIVLAFLGLNHVRDLNNQIEIQSKEISGLKHSRLMLIEAYNQEIKDVSENNKKRKVVIKEIVKTVKGSKDEECLNATISGDIVDRLRKYGR